MRLFEVHAAAREEGGLTLTLRGELDLSTIDELEAAVASRVDGRPELVVLDLRELTFLDSTGLRLMLRLDAKLQGVGGRLVLVEGPRRVQQVFELTGAADEMEIVQQLEDITAGGTAGAPADADSG
jgi:anti-anti-sigma factor